MGQPVLFHYITDIELAFARWVVSQVIFIMWLEAMTLDHVISNNVFWSDSCGHIYVIYNILGHNIASRVWHIETDAYMFISSYFFKSKRTNLCLIYKPNLCNLFFCFTWVVLDSGDSRKWIIVSRNRFVH